jgi:hypothetical protein
LWPPQRGVGLREPNLGKTNPCVSLHYSLAICFAPSLADSIIFLTLTRLVVVIIFENFSFALFTPPLGDFQNLWEQIRRPPSNLKTHVLNVKFDSTHVLNVKFDGTHVLKVKFDGAVELTSLSSSKNRRRLYSSVNPRSYGKFDGLLH